MPPSLSIHPVPSPLRRRSLVPLLLLLTGLAMPPAGLARATDTGQISGTIRALESGQLLDYANVLVESDAGGAQWGTMSLGGGRYFLRDLPAGDYRVSVLYLGYRREAQTVEIRAGQRQQLDFDLEIVVVKVLDAMRITGRARMVDLKQSGSQTDVHAEEITGFAYDSVEEVVADNAGFVVDVDGIHVRGGRADEIQWQVDGVPVSNPLGGQNLSVGRLGVAAIESVTGGQDAEFGNALSGTINIVTREGGETFEARATYMTDDFGRQDRSYTNLDHFEFGLGGPTPVPRLRYWINGDLTFSDTELVNGSYRPESEVELLGIPLFKWRRRQANQALASLKLSYAFDEQADRKLTAEYTLNHSETQPFFPNWNVQGYARQLVVLPEVESVEGGYRYTGRQRRVFHGPWMETMHRDARTVMVAEQRGQALLREAQPILELRDTSGNRFLAVVHPLFIGYQYDASSVSSVAEDSSYTAFNSANHLPRFSQSSSQAKLVFRHALTEDDYYTVRLARLGFANDVRARDDLLPHEYNHGGIRSAGLFAATDNVYQFDNGYYTDPDQPFVITGGDYPQYRDQDTVQYMGIFTLTSTRYAGHRVRSGIQFSYNDLRDELLSSPARERQDRFTGSYSQGSNANIFHSYNPEASFYVQDRWEHEGMVVNAGVRWDMFSPGSGAEILLRNDEVDRNVQLYKQQLSPRIGVAFPISDRDAFHFHYGRFIQFPSRSSLFASQDPIDNFWLGNPDLEAQLDVKYQAGIRHQFSEVLAAELALYNRDIYGLVATATVTDESTGNTLRRFINKAFANTRGVEMRIDRRLSGRWSMALNYTYSFADGVASDPAFGANPNRLEFIPNQELPLRWDRRHGVKARLRLQESSAWAIGITFDYGSGLPWTPDYRFQKRDDPLLENSQRRPSEYDVSVLAERGVNLYGQKLTLFLQAENLINQDTVRTIDPGLTPDPPLADNGYRAYLTETGKYGGALLYDVDGDARDDFVAVNDPRVFGAHRSFRIGMGWEF